MVLSGETSEQNILVGDPGVRHWGGMGAVSGDDRKRMKEGRPRRPRSLTPMRAWMISMPIYLSYFISYSEDSNIDE